MRSGAIAVALLLAAPATIAADPFPTRGGQSGILDVPDAEISLPAHVQVGAEFHYRADSPTSGYFGPLPLSLVQGLAQHIEAGMSFRNGGLPGDPRPSPLLIGAAAKYQLTAPRNWVPGVAAGVRLDRINYDISPGARAIASTERVGHLRFAGYVDTSVEVGLAGSWRRDEYEVVGETILGLDGALLTTAGRYVMSPKFGIGFGISWAPSDAEVSFFITIGYDRSGVATEKPVTERERPTVAVTPDKRPRRRRFRSPRPQFRLVVNQRRLPGEDGGRHLHYGTPPPRPTAGEPEPAPVAEAGAEPAPEPPTPAEPTAPEEAGDVEPETPTPTEPAPPEPEPEAKPEPKPTPEPLPEQPEPKKPDRGEPPKGQEGPAKPPIAVTPKVEEAPPPRTPIVRRGRLKKGKEGAEQLAEVLESYRPAIQRCVAQYLKQESTADAEGTLILRIKRRSGRVSKAYFTVGELSGTALESCLRKSAKRWTFPRSSRAYDVSTPIVVRVQGDEP